MNGREVVHLILAVVACNTPFNFVWFRSPKMVKCEITIKLQLDLID